MQKKTGKPRKYAGLPVFVPSILMRYGFLFFILIDVSFIVLRESAPSFSVVSTVLFMPVSLPTGFGVDRSAPTGVESSLVLAVPPEVQPTDATINNMQINLMT